MSRAFAWVTLGLTATMAFLIGLIAAGSLISAPAVSESAGGVSDPVDVADDAAWRRRALPGRPIDQPGGLVNFADVAERINPAVVNVEAAIRGPDRRRGAQQSRNFLERQPPPAPGESHARPQAGTGFVIESDGLILTNHHVIQAAERITVKFSDGRSLLARVVGTDPDTDIALIRVGGAKFPVAPLGDSDTLRVGEWVCAIGNPLAYEHTVTVGVVSYLGRKLFDTSLANYIQTDAAINFGNSGGPLINSHGEVVGINAAISQRANNIGFAVPINEARAILPQLKTTGRVSRGFMGVTLTDVDPDLQRSLKLRTAAGALVQDIRPASPGARAGLRAYDLVTAIDGRPIGKNDELIREVARRSPGTLVRLEVLRDGRQRAVTVRLGERPGRRAQDPADRGRSPVQPSSNRPSESGPLGFTVRGLDRDITRRLRLPDDVAGVVVSRVDPLSSAWDAGIQRGYVLMEINRQPVASVDAYQHIARRSRPGDVMALYVYIPDLEQRSLRAIRIEAP